MSTLGRRANKEFQEAPPPPQSISSVLTWVLGSNREQQVLVISKQCWSRCGLAHQCLCFSLSWQVVRDKFLPWLVPNSAISFCWYEIPGEIAVSHRAIQLLMSLENQFVTEVVLVLFYKSQIFSQNLHSLLNRSTQSLMNFIHKIVGIQGFLVFI